MCQALTLNLLDHGRPQGRYRHGGGWVHLLYCYIDIARQVCAGPMLSVYITKNFQKTILTLITAKHIFYSILFH